MFIFKDTATKYRQNINPKNGIEPFSHIDSESHSVAYYYNTLKMKIIISIIKIENNSILDKNLKRIVREGEKVEFKH